MKWIILIIICFSPDKGAAQNVGIGTTSPTGPLSFANAAGNKIVLSGDGNTGHFGIGVQSNLLQLYTNAGASGIVLGHGRSGSFTERVRIFNEGGNGMQVFGRMLLRNGTSPVDPNFGPGVWLSRPDNSGDLGFMGVQNNQNIGFFGGPAGWGFVYDAAHSRIGIANSTPAVRLDVGGADGWNLIDGEGDMRIGNAAYRLKMGIALGGGGVGAAGIMQAGGIGNLQIGAGSKYLLELSGNANYANFKGLTGGLRIDGASGASGQVLTSNGNAASPAWRNAGELLGPQTTVISGGQDFFLSDNNIRNGTPINFIMPGNSRLLVWAPVSTFKSCVIGPCQTAFEIKVYLDGGLVATYTIQGTSFPGVPKDEKSVGPIVLNPAPGAHILSFSLQNKVGNPVGAFYPQLIILGN